MARQYSPTQFFRRVPNTLLARYFQTKHDVLQEIDFGKLKETEVDTIFQAFTPKASHLADFIRLALNTGMRRGEMLGLEWKRVDLEVGLIHLEAMHTKAGRRRSVPLNDTARSVFLNRARWRAENCPASPWVFCDREG